LFQENISLGTFSGLYSKYFEINSKLKEQDYCLDNSERIIWIELNVRKGEQQFHFILNFFNLLMVWILGNFYCRRVFFISFLLTLVAFQNIWRFISIYFLVLFVTVNFGGQGQSLERGVRFSPSVGGFTVPLLAMSIFFFSYCTTIYMLLFVMSDAIESSCPGNDVWSPFSGSQICGAAHGHPKAKPAEDERQIGTNEE